eukprot:6309957-Prymnesium_polylepis.1
MDHGSSRVELVSLVDFETSPKSEPPLNRGAWGHQMFQRNATMSGPKGRTSAHATPDPIPGPP